MLQKKLDYGFNGFQVPLIPKAARSARVISILLGLLILSFDLRYLKYEIIT